MKVPLSNGIAGDNRTALLTKHVSDPVVKNTKALPLNATFG